jgi:hypothetical protein
MASKAPPPLIRSSKAFSVEIPEGSNSAKARRSDVVPNDDMDIRSKAGQYHEAELDLDKPLGAHVEDAGLHGTGFAEDPHADSQLQQMEDSHHDDHLAKLPSEDHPASATGPTIQADALKDRFGGGEAGHALATKGVNEERDALHDNVQGIAQDSLKDNRQGVGQDALHDNLQSVAQDSLKDNRQGVGQDALHDNVQGIAQDSLKDNRQGVGQDALHDNLQGIAQDSLKDNRQGIAQDSLKDNRQGVGQDALHDNLQSVAQDSLKKNLQGVGQDALHDNLQSVAQDSLKDNRQGAGQDALHDNQVGLGKEHLADHIVALPDTGGLKPGPSGKATASAHSEPHSSNASAPASSHNITKPPIAVQVKKSAEDMAHEAEVLMQAKIEKEKKLEEFHSRVDAIRKTVSGINHKLNELNDDEPSKH